MSISVSVADICGNRWSCVRPCVRVVDVLRGINRNHSTCGCASAKPTTWPHCLMLPVNSTTMPRHGFLLRSGRTNCIPASNSVNGTQLAKVAIGTVDLTDSRGLNSTLRARQCIVDYQRFWLLIKRDNAIMVPRRFLPMRIPTKRYITAIIGSWLCFMPDNWHSTIHHRNTCRSANLSISAETGRFSAPLPPEKNYEAAPIYSGARCHFPQNF